MPSDDYASASGGALKLKGAKVKKHKKKKDKSGDLERALSTTAGGSGETTTALSKREGDDARPGKSKSESDGRRSDEEEDDGASVMTKTEAQRKFEEARKKKLREIAETAHSRPELLKTHKDRVEELNVYLSKLSEHHDMPKIGPG